MTTKLSTVVKDTSAAQDKVNVGKFSDPVYGNNFLRLILGELNMVDGQWWDIWVILYLFFLAIKDQKPFIIEDAEIRLFSDDHVGKKFLRMLLVSDEADFLSVGPYSSVGFLIGIVVGGVLG